jgi:polyribonucleotide nucleotidyltransferase
MNKENFVAKITKVIPYGDYELRLETGEIARQADGAIFADMGGTQVLATVVAKKGDASSSDFFPLSVHYQEKTYAAGKVPGGYNKREGRASEEEVLISRLIDRPIRPLFPDNFFNEVQVIVTLVSLNPEVSPEIVAMLATSAALSISGLPFAGPIAAAKVGYQDGLYLLNPSPKQMKNSGLDLVVAGSQDAILMVESEAKELSEDIMLGAVMFGHSLMQPVIKGIEDLAKQVNKAPLKWNAPSQDADLLEVVHEIATPLFNEAYSLKDKMLRHEKVSAAYQQITQKIQERFPEASSEQYNAMIANLEKDLVRQKVLKGEPRIDGRDSVTVRPIQIRTGVLSRAHGSALFTRGETQALVVTTLGSERDAQSLDKLTGEEKDRFMLHYNFPPYSVGETGPLGSPKRREIGHGRLARRALTAVLPDMQKFPYVLRVVSEITESCGSSSMATVCGSSLALMDAGVPLAAPVAGVAMGLIKEGDAHVVLTDILGDEDHLGDMDFKVAGTEKGVTALQMDIKISGITEAIMKQALAQARDGRLHILSIMNSSLEEHREELSPHAPRIVTMKVPEDKIRTIIGKGGATIKSIIEITGVSIDIDDEGHVQLFSPNQDALDAAQAQIKLLIAEVEIGQTYQGKVARIVEFGAFINLLPNKDGLLHISQICSSRSQKVTEVLQEGQDIEVIVTDIDKQGRIKLEWPGRPTPAKTEAPKKETTAQEDVVSEAKETPEE